MRRLIIAGLSLLEAAVACAIFGCSLELARDIQRNPAVATVAHAVVAKTRGIAVAVRIHLRRLG